MIKDSKNFRIIAKTLSGLEEILKAEIIDLGGEKIKILNRSVEFFGNLELLYKANYLCRTATRVLVPLEAFKVFNEKDLYGKIKRIDWFEIFEVRNTIAIEAVVNHSTFSNSLYVAQLTKDAIVDKFRQKYNRRPSVDIKNPDIRINVHILENYLTVSMDASGEPLSHRGYRLESGVAPLNEVLAAGIIKLTEWDDKITFYDPMCGSGTFVIEAALIAHKIPIGYNRNKYSFMNWMNYDKKLFEKVKLDAHNQIIKDIDTRIVGTDKNKLVIKKAWENAERAGVEKSIHFEKAKFEDYKIPPSPGIIVMNPPYGERMELDEIAEFYKIIGDTLKNNCDGYNAYIFSGNLNASKQIGLKTTQKIKLYNGPKECRLLKYEVYQGSRKNKSV